jgi:RNA polymerase sigma factor (sigma-70 family)
MSPVTTSSVALQIESLYDGASVVGLTDRQLIERFTARRDATGEAAFAAIVSRHGPMVMDICRQVLRTPHDAEDAFQAVFLVLACRARAIRNPDLLANWLYAVARRTARKARVQIARRRQNDEDAMMRLSGSGSAVIINNSMTTPEQGAVVREQADALYSEIDRLPGPFRRTIVLHFFEGLTLEETARRLRCPAGTVRSRLARACEKLRRGLNRRGVALSTAAVTSALTARPASACMSSALCETTARAATIFAASRAAEGAISGAAIALANQMLRSLLVTKLRLVALALLVLGTVVAGASFVAQATARQAEKAGKPDLPLIVAKPEPKPAPGRMFVVGRVLDPKGKPVPGAEVLAYARDLAPGPIAARMGQIALGDARADGSGEFRIDAPRSSSSRHEAFGAIALAPDFGVGWTTLDPDDDHPTANITLQPEQPIHGRLFDLQGRPVPNVTLTVASIQRIGTRPPAGVLARFEGVSFWFTKINDLPAWPKSVTTDAQGRYTLRGLSRDQSATLLVHHPGFGLQRIPVEVTGDIDTKPLTAALVPAQVLTGRVTYADTGKGVPHAPLEVMASQGRLGIPVQFETDQEGRFRLLPPPADRTYGVTASSPVGEPYLSVRKSLVWPKGALEQSIDFSLPRGVLIQGNVIDEVSGKPVSGATVGFIARDKQEARDGSGNRMSTEADGSFRVGAPPRPGYLIVKAPSNDYVYRAISTRMLEEGQPGGRWEYANAFSFLDLKPGIGNQEVKVALRRGETVTGQVVGPDGQPVREAWIFSRAILDPRVGLPGGWTARSRGAVRNGRFELHGLDPDNAVPVYLLDAKRKLGAVVNLPIKSGAGAPVPVRLEPCGAARARFVDPAGKPVTGRLTRELTLTMVITPGPVSATTLPAGLVAAEQADVRAIDTVNYTAGLITDAEGRLTVPVLIPGATYRFVDYTMVVRGKTGPQARKEFTVEPGETLDLGDILIEKPGA